MFPVIGLVLTLIYQYGIYARLHPTEKTSDSLPREIAAAEVEPSIVRRWMQKQNELGFPIWKDIALPGSPLAYRETGRTWKVAVWERTSGEVEFVSIADAPVREGKVAFQVNGQALEGTVEKDLFVAGWADKVYVGMSTGQKTGSTGL